ncbi:MAG: PKD domain-containing protein [Flavobacteriales bacterium]|nr:PKD domain-containing protein [Flavobacteriales bacterium]
MRLKALPKFLFILLFSVFAESSSAQYQVNGNAVSTSCNCWRLTSASNSQNGSVWNINLFDLSNPFNFNFDVFLGCNDGGADGIAFVLQPLSVNAGSSGGGIGYQGINPSLAVELDNYQNGGEPSYDHMAIQRNGDVSHTSSNNLAGPVPISASSNNVEDCAWHTLNVVWNPTTQTLTVYFDGVLRLTYTGDIINNIFGGNPNVYWGFTSATGGANNLHQFCNALDPGFIVASPSQCVGTPTDFESTSTVATGFVTDYQWDFGDGNTASGTQVSNTYAAPGTYTVTLTITSEGCTESTTTQVTINPQPNFTLGSDQSICDGDSYQIVANGLVGGEQLLWNPTTGLDNPGVSNPTATPATTTTYTLGVMDANGCVNSDDIEIVVNPLPVADAGPDQTICDGDVTTMAASGGVQYLWNPTTDLADATSATTSANPTTTTLYALTVTDANGCVDTDDMTITVNPLPVVDAGADEAICNQQTVQLGASGALNYGWLPASGLDDASIANPTFSGNSTTTFTVTGTDANGCSSTDDVEVTVFPLPVADFAQPADVCLTYPTIITDNSSGTGLVYNWDFGDGNSSSNPAPAHTYATDGTFTIVLDITDANGCQATHSESATVLPLPEPQMNITDGQEFCEFEEIQFENETSGSITDVHWDFGDNAFLPAYPNTQSSLDNPTFFYDNFAFSPYTVTLIITDNNGCQNYVQSVIIVHDKPEAEFTSTIVCEGNATQFTDESTVLLTTVINWQWEFGDNFGTSSQQNPSYLYQSTGIYTVELIATTNAGCSDTAVHQVIVNPVPVVSISGIDTCLNDETSFANNTIPQDNTITDWNWDFGDGNTSTDIVAANTYADHGIFTVSLTATTDSGCAATGTTQIEVFPNPEPAFSVYTAEGCTPHEVLFIDESTIASGVLDQYLWNLGDSTISTSPNPTNVYPDSGYYDITLSVTSAEGCNTVITVEDAVRANITPVARFDILKERVSLLDAELELAESSEHGLEWYWNFGDGTTSEEIVPEHTYGEPGIYDVVLIVTNGDCQDVAYGKIVVDPIFTFYIPSAFTPDDDGINETFYGTGEAVQIYNMKISDRWGELLFESNSPDYGWDGTYKGKQVQAGLYVYEFYILDIYEQDHLYTGHFNLLR